MTFICRNVRMQTLDVRVSYKYMQQEVVMKQSACRNRERERS